MSFLFVALWKLYNGIAEIQIIIHLVILDMTGSEERITCIYLQGPGFHAVYIDDACPMPSKSIKVYRYS
jgi:hypothetical protein